MLRWLCWWRPPCLLRRVIVNFTHTETEAFDAVLWSSHGSWLTFKDVSALKAGREPLKLPGDQVIHRDRIAYLQVLP